jgi:hypothetical protein
MSLPKYDANNKHIQDIFYSEVKRQMADIKKIENKSERSRRMSRLKVDVYRAVVSSNNLIKSKKTFMSNLFIRIKQVIFSIVNRLIKKE